MKNSVLFVIVVLIVMTGMSGLAFSVSKDEAKSLWPYDEKILDVRNDSSIESKSGTETMATEFLIKDKKGACHAYPTLLKRPAGSQTWGFDSSQAGYDISCTNHKRIRTDDTAVSAASDSQQAPTDDTSDGNNGNRQAPQPGEHVDKALDKADQNINRVERAKSTMDWLKNF